MTELHSIVNSAFTIDGTNIADDARGTHSMAIVNTFIVYVDWSDWNNSNYTRREEMSVIHDQGKEEEFHDLKKINLD